MKKMKNSARAQVEPAEPYDSSDGYIPSDNERDDTVTSSSYSAASEEEEEDLIVQDSENDENQDQTDSEHDSAKMSDTDYFAEIAPMTFEDDDDAIMINEDRSHITKTPPPPPELALEVLTLDEKSNIDAYMYMSLSNYHG